MHNQQGFFCDKLSGFVAERGVVDVIYFDF